MRNPGVHRRSLQARTPIVVALALLAWAVATGGNALTLRVLSRPVIPDSIQGAHHLRYEDDHTLVLACFKLGTLELPIAGENRTPRLLVPTSGPHSVFLSFYVGLSQQFLAVAAPVYQIAWMSRAAPERFGEMAVDSPVNIDVWQDRLLLIGYRKGPDGKRLTDGAMAWLGSLNDGLKDLKPVLFSLKGPGKNPFGLWNVVEAGKVRFLADGSFVIVPGVEPGIYLYGPDGHLTRTWDSEALGIDVASDDSTEHSNLIAADMAARAAFVNARRLVDEILPLPQGPALVVRRVEGLSVHWTLKVLRPDGHVEEVNLPIEEGSPYWHVAGDVRGNRIMILLWEFAVKRPTVFAPSRLVELGVTP